MLLTNEERQRFITYLRQWAESNRQLIDVAKDKPYAQVLVPSLKQELDACLIITAKLETIESVTIN